MIFWCIFSHTESYTVDLVFLRMHLITKQCVSEWKSCRRKKEQVEFIYTERKHGLVVTAFLYLLGAQRGSTSVKLLPGLDTDDCFVFLVTPNRISGVVSHGHDLRKHNNLLLLLTAFLGSQRSKWEQKTRLYWDARVALCLLHVEGVRAMCLTACFQFSLPSIGYKSAFPTVCLLSFCLPV